MKKLSILLIGLLLISGMAFAADVPVESSATIEGSASVTFGVDLNEGTTGFHNDATSSLTVTLVPEQDITVGGDDGVYGEITIEKFKFENGTATSGDVSAKLVISPLEVKIYSAPGFDIDKAPVFGNEDIVFDDDPADAAAGNEQDVATAITAVKGSGIYGITITVPVDPITVDLKFASDGDYTAFAGSSATNGEFAYGDEAADVNEDNNYVIGTDLTVDVSPITVGLGVTYGWFSAPVFGVGATVDVEVADVLYGLETGVGFDGFLNVDDENADFMFDADYTATLKLTEETDDDDPSTFTTGLYVAPYADGEELDLDVKFAITEDEAAGFVPNVGASVGVELHDLVAPDGNELNFAILTTAGYNDGGIDLGLGFNYFSDDVVELNASIGLLSDLTGVDNTAFTLRYSADDLTASGNGASANEVGVVEFITEISF